MRVEAMVEEDRIRTAGQPSNCVLLVDDDEMVRQVLELQLDLLGYEVEVACSGAQALELFAQGDYRIILTDCRMPDMDGYQLARAIRSDERARSRPMTPILAITGRADDQWQDAGMNAVLAKPVALDDLERILADWA